MKNWTNNIQMTALVKTKFIEINQWVGRETCNEAMVIRK